MEFILSHEHPVIRSPGMWEQYPQTVDRALVRDRLTREYRQARDHGVRAIVDVSTVDLGRETALVQDAAEAAGMRVVHATGVWLDIPQFMAPRYGPLPSGVDDIAPLFISDIREGIAGTGIKAGVVKLASDASLVDATGRLIPKVERVFRAGAIASKETGCPITTHTDSSRAAGMSQIAVFEDIGVDPAQVVIGHSSRAEISYLVELLERGYYLSFDSFAYDDGERFTGAISRLLELCRLGWSHRVMMGHDYSGYDGFAAAPPARELSGWCRIPLEVKPALERAGISADDLANLCNASAQAVFKL